MDGRVVAVIPKNAREELRITKTVYQGIPLLDVRVYSLPVSPGERAVPTKKGLSLRPDTWRELLPQVEAALDDTEEEDKVAETVPDSRQGSLGMDEDPFAGQ